ncbi:MAG: guanylate kinase [Acidimicrobiales bacterium]
MSAEALLVIFIGPGGVGKGTLAQRVVDADEHMWLSRSWTTRTPRPRESEDDYHFVDRAAFEKAIEARGFLEWAEFHGNLYGTPLPIAPDGCDVLLEIEVQGAEQVLASHPHAVVFLILPPSMDLLEERLRARGDDDEHVADRLASAPAELARGRELATYVVVNDDVERAASEILSILEGLRRQRRDFSSKD